MTELFKGKIQSSARFIENHFNFSKLKLDWNTFSFFTIIGLIVLLTGFALSYVMNENLERLEYTFLHISLVFIVAGILISIFVKSYVSSEICNSWKRFLSGEYFSSYFKVIEIAAVIAAALTLYIEFGFQRPQEREVRNAQLLAQIADLSSGNEEKKATTSPAVKNIMQLLARENVPMEGISVQRMILKKAELENAILTEANLRKAKLSGSNLTGAELTGAELTDAELTDAELTDAELTDAELADAELVRADLTDADLISANLTKADLTSVKLTSADLTDAVLADAVLRWSNLIYANFTDANLSNADLTGARLIDTNLTDANLTDANLNGADLTGADLTGADLANANFSEADLTDANLNGADLVCAYLKETKFGNNQGLTQDMLDSALPFGAPKDNLPEGIEWKYAESNGNAGNTCKYLAGFNLSGLDLSEADLTGADLTDADLTDANLTGAIIAGANLSRTVGLTQDMLNSLAPSAPPMNLPDGLEWPFIRNEDGEWISIEPAPAAPN